MTHFELQISAKAASLVKNLFLGNLKRQRTSADHKPEPSSHLRWDSVGISPYQKGDRKKKLLALNKSYFDGGSPI